MNKQQKRLRRSKSKIKKNNMQRNSSQSTKDKKAGERKRNG